MIFKSKYTDRRFFLAANRDWYDLGYSDAKEDSRVVENE